MKIYPKKFFVLPFLMAIFCVLACQKEDPIVETARKCPPGDFLEIDGYRFQSHYKTFSTQRSIDYFPLQYPECTDPQLYIIVSGADINNLDGFSQVNSMISLEISKARLLTDLSGLHNLTSILGIKFEGNDILENLTGMDKLETIYSIAIVNNPSLKDISGLEKFTTISDYLVITNNDALLSLESLGKLTSVGSSLNIRNNSSLTSLEGIDQLTSVGVSFDNPNLYETTLNISQNAKLRSLIGLESITSINGKLSVSENPVLISLSGLQQLEPETITGLKLENSPNLAICHVQSICDYLSVKSNPATIIGNANGCRTRVEVEQACEDR